MSTRTVLLIEPSSSDGANAWSFFVLPPCPSIWGGGGVGGGRNGFGLIVSVSRINGFLPSDKINRRPVIGRWAKRETRRALNGSNPVRFDAVRASAAGVVSVLRTDLPSQLAGSQTVASHQCNCQLAGSWSTQMAFEDAPPTSKLTNQSTRYRG